MSKMNLPNRLTVMRLCLVPVFAVILMLPPSFWTGFVGMLIYIGASLTDMYDGKIARKYNLITDFGKLLDPLADKFMNIGALLVILYRSVTVEDFYSFAASKTNEIFNVVFFWAVLIMIFRELAVTSLRLMVAGAGTPGKKDLSANILGKVKTCTQIACVIACIVEQTAYWHHPYLDFLQEYMPLSFLSTALMTVFTVWSGIHYAKEYSKYLDPKM